MVDTLRDFGISELGIDGPALYVVMAIMACLIVNAQLPIRAAGTPTMRVLPFYLVAVIMSATMMWVAFQLENENARYVVALAYLGLLIFGTRWLGRRYLGARAADDPKAPGSRS